MSVNRKIATDSIKTAVATFGMQGVAFAVSILVAQFYGATSVTDAYFFALAVPTLFTAALFGALKAVFVPVYTEYVTQHPEDRERVLGAVYSVVLLLSLLAASLLYLLAPYLMPLVAGGLADLEAKKLVITLSRELIPLAVISSLIGLMGSIYHSYQRFLVPIISPIWRTLLLFIFVIFLRDRLGIHALTYGTVLGELLSLVFMVFALRWRRIYVGFQSIFHPVVYKMARLSVAPIFGNFVLEFNPLVDKIMIASTAVGSVTALNIASKWNDIPLMLLSSGGFMSVILSHWSKLKAEEDMKEVIRSLEQALTMVVFVLLPFLTAFFVFRTQIINYFYLRKEFSLEAAGNVALLWGVLLWGVLPVLTGRILVRVYHVMQDTVTPFWIGISRTTLNVILNFIFRAYFGLVGIALSSILTQYILTTVNFVLLRRRIKELRLRRLLLAWSRMFGCALVAGLMMYLVYSPVEGLSSRLLSQPLLYPVVAIGVSSLLGLIAYLALSVFLCVSEVRVLLVGLRLRK